VVDKNGFVESSVDSNLDRIPTHASALFHRRECVVIEQDERFAIPEESPIGVQLRVASIVLLHTVVRLHSDAFFNADGATPIGKPQTERCNAKLDQV
jgi:hypothetical protein